MPHAGFTMFESLSVHSGASRTRRVFLESLPLSIVSHCAAAGVVILSITSRVWFPIDPPRILVSYVLAGGSGALPPPPAAPSDSPSTPVAPPQPRPELPVTVAPTVVPDLIPAPPQAAADGDTTDSTGATGGVAGGLLLDDGRIQFGRGGILPTAALQIDPPSYPEVARRARLEGDVVVRYVVGTNGFVKEAVVVEPAIAAMFDEAALAAVRAWRFEPLFHLGQVREVVHEVVIMFRLRPPA